MITTVIIMIAVEIGTKVCVSQRRMCLLAFAFLETVAILPN